MAISAVNSLWHRIRERKVVQLGLAYLAGSWLVLQVLDVLGQNLGMPEWIFRVTVALLAVGFLAALVLAWYHGEQGRQRVSGMEVAMLAGILMIAGGVLALVSGNVGRSGGDAGVTVPEEAGFEPPAEKPDTGPSIAVLPLRNLSDGGPHAYFAAGLHDELLTQLAKVEPLTVIGRTSVMAYAGSAEPLREIAEGLGVSNIVEGSVQVLGERLRVNVQLLNARTGANLWAERYDRTLDDAFAVQSEIARQVAEGVGAEISGAEANAIARAPTQNPEAYRLFLQAEAYRHPSGDPRETYQTREELYQQAIALDSTFALAYASLSRVHGSQYWNGYDRSPTRLERMRAAAGEARRLAPDLPQVRVANAWVYYRQRDYAQALEEFELAAEGLPGSADLRQNIGNVHRRLGQWSEALAAFERAARMNPQDARLFEDGLGLTLMFLHRYGEAIAAFDRALAVRPDFWDARLDKAWTHLLWHGEPDSLRTVLEHGREHYTWWGSRDLWRARLALWDRDPETLLAMLGTPESTVFVAQDSWEPGHLYAAWAHQLRGDPASATHAFAGALVRVDSMLHARPDDPRLHISRGLALAGLGRAAEARAEADWVRTHVPGAYDRGDLVRYEGIPMIFAQAGLVEEAIEELDALLDGPSYTSVPKVRIDPRYDPIRDHPRFQALLEKHEDVTL